jgi:hypothetical protein
VIPADAYRTAAYRTLRVTVDRMSSDRIPEMILKYQPKGKKI